jgi:hypothetical protein
MKKSALVKRLLKELGVTIDSKTKYIKKNIIPNALTKKVIEDAHKGIGLSGRVENINYFVDTL